MKAIVLALRGRGKHRVDIMAVIPWTRRFDREAPLVHVGAQKSRLVTLGEANNLTGCVRGAISFFTFSKELILIFKSSSLNFIIPFKTSH